MAKIIRLTESDLTKLVSRIIKEQQLTSKRFIAESMAESQNLFDEAESIVDSGKKPDQIEVKKVLSCLKQEGFVHLTATTIGVGSYAMGMLLTLLGLGAAPYSGGMSLALSGAIIILLESVGINDQGVRDEVDRLIKCYNGKKIVGKEMGEASSPAQQAAIAINMKKKGIKPKNETLYEDEYGSVQSIDYNEEFINEAEYQGRKVQLGKIMQGDVKKSKVYVKNDKGKVVKVNFGFGGKSAHGKRMTIKKNNPERRKSFRARHNCENPGPRWKPRYWACRTW